MKLKRLPEDFIVEEVNELKIVEKGSHKLYLLEKKGLETFYAIKYLSRTFKIPSSEIGFAGLKDRHALTRQYLTIPSKYNIKDVIEKNLKIKYVGMVEKGLKLGMLEGNRFIITVRDINKSDIEGIKQNVKDTMQNGVPNYFDSQRFGSNIEGEFIARHLMKKDYESAVKVYVTEFSKSELSRVKNEKRDILSKWGNFNNLSFSNLTFKSIIEEYLKTKDWLKAYKRIPANIREMFISSYQSYIWNQCVKRLLFKYMNKRRLYYVKYKVGSLVFYSNEEPSKVPKTFKTISERLDVTGDDKEIFDEVLKKEGIEVKDFAIREEVGDYFVTREREVISRPKDFEMSEFEIDEFNPRKYKLRLSFSLSRGSYATIITKRIFGQ